MKRACVIGGGISGLACLHRLRQSGVDACLLESSSGPGGVITTVAQNGFLFEAGPQSFLLTDALRTLVRELNLENEIVTADPKAPRFVLRKGRLHEIPMAPGAILRTSLLGLGTKARLIAEPLRRSRPPSREETVADFVRRKFGSEILDYLVAPFISGVYAGDPEKLSLASSFPSAAEWERDYGSVIRGAMKSAKSSGPRPPLASFRGGMGTLPARLAQSLHGSIQFGVAASSLSFERGQFHVATENAAVPLPNSFDAVVLATPAYVSARRLPNAASALRDLLLGISYAPVAVVAAGYSDKQIGSPVRGFGFLVPRKEGCTILGTVWNSSLFPGRAPEGMSVLTSFAGGATDLKITQASDADILDKVASENARIMRISGPPIEHAIFRYPRALPQYTLGHAQRIGAIQEGLNNLPGLFLTGNYLAGPSIGNCVEHATRTAEAVRAFLPSGAGASP